jgi:hypothetical protein
MTGNGADACHIALLPAWRDRIDPASWGKLGFDGAAACLGASVNDLGGILMNESVNRAAGGRWTASLCSRPPAPRDASFNSARPYTEASPKGRKRCQLHSVARTGFRSAVLWLSRCQHHDPLPVPSTALDSFRIGSARRRNWFNARR